MAIFNSYVKLPMGQVKYHRDINIVTDTHLEHRLEKFFFFNAENYVMEQPETLTLRTSQNITYLFFYYICIIMIY